MSVLPLRTQKSVQKNEDKKRTILNKLNVLLLLIEIGLILYLGWLAIANRLLQSGTIVYATLGGVAFVLIVQLILIVLRKARVFNFIFLLGAIAVLGFAGVKFTELVSLFHKFEQRQNVSEYQLSIVVRKNSPITTIEQLKNKKLQAPLSYDTENITALLEQLKSEKNLILTPKEVDSYHTAYQNLISGEADAIVLSSSFEELLASQYPEFEESITKIYEFKRQKVSTRTQRNVATTQKVDVFNIYLSGIDTYGAITEVSRSDVNIIATVNTKTRQILLTSTPRDAYVKIADGGRNQYDKLTHAGLYGVDASVHTLENLYGTKIDYYARINFTTFMKMVDLVGGVEVDNDYAFQSTVVPDLYFKAGKQTLNSYQALAYVRERYALEDGDVGRAANQTEVIQAILKKLLSPKLLSDSGQLIAQLGQSSQTDMGLETLMAIINDYIDGSDKPYTMTSQALKVNGVVGLPSYAMPGADLWMGRVDESSLEIVTENIESVMQGGQPTVPIVTPSQE